MLFGLGVGLVVGGKTVAPDVQAVRVHAAHGGAGVVRRCRRGPRSDQCPRLANLRDPAGGASDGGARGVVQLPQHPRRQRKHRLWGAGAVAAPALGALRGGVLGECARVKSTSLTTLPETCAPRKATLEGSDA